MKADYETAEKSFEAGEENGELVAAVFCAFFICIGFFHALEGFCLGEKIWFIGGTVYSGVVGLVYRLWEI